MTDQEEATCKVTRGDLGKLTDALAADLEKHSKTTLLLFLANRTVSDAYFRYGTLAAVGEAHSELLAQLKGWAKTGAMVNRGKRVDALLKRHDAAMTAIKEGRPLPKTKRKRRRLKAEKL